jgi:hypothetical protein
MVGGLALAACAAGANDVADAGTQERLDRKADQLVQVVAAQDSELPVGEDDPAVLIGDQDPVGESIGERLPGIAYLHAIAAGPPVGIQASRSCAGPRARNTARLGTDASEPASDGSWAQRTTRTGRWA